MNRIMKSEWQFPWWIQIFAGEGLGELVIISAQGYDVPLIGVLFLMILGFGILEIYRETESRNDNNKCEEIRRWDFTLDFKFNYLVITILAVLIVDVLKDLILT